MLPKLRNRSALGVALVLLVGLMTPTLSLARRLLAERTLGG